MGTRNITRVILNGERVVEQYCQWDGYPTGQGREVMRFVKRYCGNHIETFKAKLSKSTLRNINSRNTTYTGAPYSKELHDKVKQLDGFFVCSISSEDLFKAVTKKQISLDEATKFLVSDRDSGPDVLYWLMLPDVPGMEFYTDDYCQKIGDSLDWQIEGLYTLNLDEKWVEINYHGMKRRYDFETVISMTDKEIEDEMKDLEKKDDERYEDGI